MKIAVLGVGGSGSAALRFLAKAGHEAVGFEQFELGHAMGSSHGNSRIIRYSYPDPFHTKLMAKSYELWDELESEAKEELFVRCGGITFGPADEPLVENTRLSLESAGLDYEILSRDEVFNCFPALDIGENAIGIFQSKSGFLRATNCVLANARLAKNAGALIHENSPVIEIEEVGEHVFVSTEEKTEAFDAVIVSAGPWIGKLLSPLELHLPVKTALRQIIYAGIKGDKSNFTPEKLPIWIEKPAEYYGFPMDGVIDGIKFASHGAGVDFDPDIPLRPIMEEHLERAMKHIKTRFPDVSDEVIFAQSCLYTNTPDEKFILDFAPHSKRLVICSGCSGHGFKFTVLLGKIAAMMATGEKFSGDISPWNLERF